MVIGAIVADVVIAACLWVSCHQRTYAVYSRVTLTASAFRNDDGSCGGLGAVTAIGRGASVTVTDAHRVTLATGKLSNGRLMADTQCVFYYTVIDIPTGKGTYGISVAGHTTIRVPERKLTDPQATIIRVNAEPAPMK